MTLPTPDIEKLRELAMKATPGVHEARYVPGGMPTTCCDFGVISHATGKETARVWLREDVEFYAAANPQTILALLDSLPSPVSVPEGDARERARAEAHVLLMTCKPYADGEIGPFLRDHVAAALLSAESRGRPQWQPIETAPKDKRFLAAIHHGAAGYIVVHARRVGPYVQDTEDGSCVGWSPKSKRPAYWQPLPAPPSSPEEG